MVGDIPGYMPMMPEGPYLVQLKLYKDVLKDDGTMVKVVDQVVTLGTSTSKLHADDMVSDYVKTTAGANYIKGRGKDIQAHVIYQGSSSMPLHKVNTDEVDMVASSSLGSLDDWLNNKANSTYAGAGLIDYIGAQSLRRSYRATKGSAKKSIEEIAQRYAYTQGKDGFLAKGTAEMEYARYVAEKYGHYNTAKYIEKAKNGFLGRKSNSEEAIDGIINNTLLTMQKFPAMAQAMERMGMNPGSNRLRALTSSITKMGSFVALGFNPATALLQYTIAGTNVLPLVGFRRLTQAYSKVSHVVNPPKGGHTKDIYKDYEEIFDALELRTIKNDGTVLDIYQNANQPLVKDPEGFYVKAKKGKYKEALGQGWKATQDASMWMFHLGDRTPRMWTAIAARDMADDVLKSIEKKQLKKGFDEDPYSFLTFNERTMYEKMDRLGMTKGKVDSLRKRGLMNDFAIEFTNKTNHSYNTTHVPLAFTEAALRPFLQFKTWIQKQTMFWFNIIGDRPTKAGFKDQYKDLMYVTGAMTALGGVMSLPGTQEIDALMRKVFGVSPKAWLMEQDSTFMDFMTGGAAAFAGVSLEGRMGPGNLLTTIDPGNIAGIYPARLFKAGQSLWKGNPERALNYTLPKALQNLRQGFTLATTGELRGTYDKNLLIDYNKLDGDPYYKALIKTIGYESMEESTYRNLKFALLDKSRFTGRQRAWTKNEIFELINEGDIVEAKEVAKEANIKWSELLKLYKNKYLKEEVESFNYTYSTQNPEIKKGQEAIKRIMENLE